MNPNLMDCWFGSSLVELYFREFAAEGQREPFTARHRAAPAAPRRVTAARQQLGSLLVRAGQRLLGVQAIAEQGVGARRIAVAA